MASLRGFFAGHDFQGVLKTPKWVMMMLCGFLYLKSVSDQAKAFHIDRLYKIQKQFNEELKTVISYRKYQNNESYFFSFTGKPTDIHIDCAK